MITGIIIIFFIIALFPFSSSNPKSRDDSDWWDSLFLWVLLSELFKSSSDKENHETSDPDNDYEDED